MRRHVHPYNIYGGGGQQPGHVLRPVSLLFHLFILGCVFFLFTEGVWPRAE